MARSAEDIQRRVEELTNAFNFYLKNHCQDKPHYKIDVKACAGELTDVYFEIIDAEGQLKSLVKENMDSSKIASLTEILIMKMLPLEIEDCEDEVLVRNENASLAFVTAVVFVNGMSKRIEKDGFDLRTNHNQLNDRFSEIIKDHITWVEIMDPDTTVLPICANAGFWKLFDLFANLLPSLVMPLNINA